MTGLVEFLKARLDEDEQVARFVIDGPGEVMRRGLDLQRIEINGEIRYAFLTLDPERMVAEVEGKRRIIEMHGPNEYGLCGVCVLNDDERRAPCPTLRLLALPYASHPEYDESWRP